MVCCSLYFSTFTSSDYKVLKGNGLAVMMQMVTVNGCL